MTTEEELTNKKIVELENKLIADKARMVKLLTETTKLDKEMNETKEELKKLKEETKEKAVENNTALGRVEKEYDEFQAQILAMEKILKIVE